MARVCPCRRMGLDSVKAGPLASRGRGKGSQFRTEESVPLVERGVGVEERGETGRGLEGSPASQRRGRTQAEGPQASLGQLPPVLLGLLLELSILQNQSVFWRALASNCVLCPPPRDPRVN